MKKRLSAVAAVTLMLASPASAQVAQNSASGPAAANVTAAAPSRAPRIKTELALACLLGMGHDGCQAVFVGAIFNQFIATNPPPLNAYVAWRLVSNCVSGNLFGCRDGALERVDYLGTNLAGGDVYTAKFMHHEKTYVLSQPTPEGKIPAFWIINRPANWIIIKKELVELQPPVLPPRTIYSREP